MRLLILIHVLSAVVGVGPTFFGHILFRQNQSLEELRHSMRLGKKLDFFPKIGGTLAVLSGIVLLIAGNYGPVTQLWLFGSLILYLFIQILAIGFLAPATKKLNHWLFDPASRNAYALPDELHQLFRKSNRLYYTASTLGIILFVFMIMKP